MSFAVLFDYDGTLVDTEPVILACYQHLFDTYDSPFVFDETIKQEVIGPTLKEEIGKLFPSYDTKLLIEDYKQYQLQFDASYFKKMDGADEVIALLQSRHVPLGIVSSRSLDSLLGLIGDWDVFDVVIGHGSVAEDKPSPMGIYKALSTLGCNSGMYVGDNVSDVLAGKNAGMFTVGYVSRMANESALKASEPDVLIYNLKELISLLKRLDV